MPHPLADPRTVIYSETAVWLWHNQVVSNQLWADGASDPAVTDKRFDSSPRKLRLLQFKPSGFVPISQKIRDRAYSFGLPYLEL